MTTPFLGKGWAFPVRTDGSGRIALVGLEEKIRESVWIILSTRPGERPRRPEFGCGIHDLVFAPTDAATVGQIAFEVRASLERWEPRIDLDAVHVRFDAVDAGTLYIDVLYRIRGTNDPRNLVFPFYVIPSHPATQRAGSER